MKSKIKVILHFAKPHKGKFTLLFTCIIVTIISGAFYPYIFGRLVDEVFYGKNMSIFMNIVLIYGVVYLFNQLMHFALNMSWASLMTKFLYDIRTAVFRKVLTYKGEKLSSMYSGDIIARMSGDTDQFMNFIHWNVFYTIGGILNLILSIVFIWHHNMWIALFTIALTPAIVYISRCFAKKARKYYEDIAKQNGELSSWLFEILKGMQDIKLLGAAKSVLSDFVGKTIKIMRLQIKSDRVEVTSERVNTGISLLAQISLYIISAIFILRDNLTVGGFTACVSYFGTCVAVFNNLNGKAVNIASNMVAIGRVIGLLNEKSENYNESVPKIKIKDGAISFSNVCFSYNYKFDVLKDISLNVGPGEKISIVGRSGSGKTTIANLLYKLYEVQKGEIKIDGVNINDFNLYNLREQIGIVHQENILFNSTVRFNLSYSNNNENDDVLWNALKMSNLYDFVQGLPNGLDTVIGGSSTGNSNGINFSGGQKQRLAIARIFVKNPKILIFDEATSSLDSEAESVIKSSWDELCSNRTIVVIAHRLSTIINSDRVAVINDGQLAGFDSHQKLLEYCTPYMELFKEQYGKSEVVQNA